MRLVLYTVACLVLPIVWGVLVNFVFSRWEKKNRPEDRISDYQI